MNVPRLNAGLVFSIALSAQSAGVYAVSVAPKPGDTFAGPCRFELTIAARETAVRATLVIFDRGRETRAFYDDRMVFEFASKYALALLWVRHCPTADADIDPAPAHGLGRAVLAALDQLAQSSKHHELATSKVILLGFDQAGSLAAAMPAFAADRALASVVYAPLGVAAVNLAVQQSAIPQLVIANGADPVAGTRESYDYFDRHFANGAPWAFALQNGASHDGALAGAKDLILSWIEMLLTTTPDTTAPISLMAVQRTGWWLYVQMQDTALRDAGGQAVARAKDAKIEKVGQSAPASFRTAGWMPSKKSAGEWQSFVRKQSHVSEAKY